MAKSIVDYLHPYKVRITEQLDAPVLTATTEGTPGLSVYQYRASFVTLVGQSLPGEIITVENGNSTLNGFDRIKLSVATIPESVTYVRFWKLVGGEWAKIADVDASVGQLYDFGQSTSVAVLPTENSSGRPDVIAICPKPGTLNQRISWMDLQAIWLKHNQEQWDTIHKNGDVILGCQSLQSRGLPRQNSTAYLVGDIVSIDNSTSQFTYECTVAGNTAASDPGSWPIIKDAIIEDGEVTWKAICKWNFLSGTVYLFGIHVKVDAGQVDLAGTGEEVVGLTITPAYTTPEQDLVQRAGIDEGVPQERANTGPDWLYLSLQWGINVPGQIKIREFLDGVPKQVTFQTQRSTLDTQLDRQRFDTSGDFVVDKFPFQVFDHDTDPTKLILSISDGKAYPHGHEVEFKGTRRIEFNKARETKTVNNSGVDVFDSPGGFVIGDVADEGVGFDLSGLAIKLKVGLGNYHTITFTSDGMTPDDVAAFIEASVNIYGSVDLVNCVSASGMIKIQAQAGKTLEIAAVDSSVYTALGIATGTYQPIGTRLYPLNDHYIKTVTDLNYKIEEVVQITHNGTTHVDVVGENVVAITGASVTLADCHDSKFDYNLGVDYTKDGNSIDFTLGGAEPVGGATYFVKIQRNYNATLASRILVEVIDAQIIKSAEDGEDVIVFTDATSIKKVSDPTQSVSVSGSAKDVTEILRVNNTPGQSVTQYTACSLNKNSGAITHEYSSLSWSAAGTPGTTGLGQPATDNTYYVSFRAWYHAVEGDVVSANSYDLYPYIESFATYPLRDCLDFRTDSGVMPMPNEDPTFDYEYYLSRIDKLTLDENANFRITTGAPAINPPVPPDQSGVQSLAIIRIAPYTYSKADTKVTSLEVMRLTQRQIQNVADDVTKIKYWMAVNDLEKEANNKQIYGLAAAGTVSVITLGSSGGEGYTLGDTLTLTGGTSAATVSVSAVSAGAVTGVQLLSGGGGYFKNIDNTVSGGSGSGCLINILGLIGQTALASETQGIFTDALTGFGRCDLQYNKGGVSFTAAIDTTARCIRLGASKNTVELSVDTDNSVNVREAGNSIMLDYQPEVIEEQPYAGITVNGASDFVVTNYYGNLRISPEVDVFMDETQLPAVNVDFDNNLTALTDGVNALLANSVNWENWSNGEPSENTIEVGVAPGLDFLIGDGVVSSNSETTTRTGTYNQLIPGSITQSLGNRVVDLSLQGMMRAGQTISVDATGLLPNVDHTISMGGIVCDLTYDNTPTNHAGQAGTHTYSGKTTVTSSNDGCITATFLTPTGIPIGNTTITIFYYADPTISCASAAYYTAGFMQSNQETTVGLPTTEMTTNTVSETGEIVTDYMFAYIEPLAQSFTLKEPAYIAEVHLAFATKHSTLGYTVQIRNMVNGYPGTTVFASKHLSSDNILLSTDSSVYTEFHFDNVLKYSANVEYCFIGLPEGSNTGYNLYAFELSTIDLLTGVRLTAQQESSGVLFHSPNNTTWEPWTKRDLKYKLIKSNFENNCQIYWTNLTGIQAHSLALAVQEFVGGGVNSIWSCQVRNADTGVYSGWIPFNPSINTALLSEIDQVQLRVDVTSLGGNYQVIAKFAGILLLYHNAEGWYIGNDELFTDDLTYPNKITVYLDLDTDGTNGAGVRSVTPYASIDDGLTMFELPLKENYTPVGASVEPFVTYCFETPDEATVIGASNTSPIVISSPLHGYKDNMVALIYGVEGNVNANGIWRVTNATDNTFELYSPSGVISVGSGAYTTGGTIVMNEFNRVREFVKLTTSNRAVTPKVMNPTFIEGRVE
jgi:hypothetical protein